MKKEISAKIRQIAVEHGYDARVLADFAEFICEQSKSKKSDLTIAQMKSAIAHEFGCTVQQLTKLKAFKLAIAGRNLNLRLKSDWLALYREWVGVPQNEQNEQGATCINGIDVLKNFRPWQVFGLDPDIATADDIKAAFRQLSKVHHPDHGGDRAVFERLQKMRDSLLAFR